MPPHHDPSPPSTQDALLDAVQSVLTPLAELAVAKGLPFSMVEESFKQAFVRAAENAQVAQGLPAHRLVSRISTTTGISRREVTRITQSNAVAPAPESASLASQVFTRWLSERKWRVRGQPRALPRQGAEPSFEALAKSVTQDVHPRTLLDELCRLKLATWDTTTDTVSLIQDGFAPRGDWPALMAFLGHNVGDHLRGAVTNVLNDEPVHFEQAVFADGLSEASVEQVRALARSHWKTLLSETVPLLEERIEADRHTPSQATRRVRLGLFSFQQDMTPPPSETGASPANGQSLRRPVKGK